MTLSRSQMLFATVVALAVLWLLPMVASKSHLYTATQVVVFGLFAISFNLMFGYLGLLSFGHAAYFGTGAYAAALLLSAYPSLSIPSAVFAGAVAGALVGLLVGAFCVRLKGTYFAMLTLAFGQLVFGVAWKWRSVTRGDDGFGAFIDRDIAFLGLSFSSTDIVVIYFFVTTVALVVAAAVWLLLSTTPFGSVVAAIKQNDQRAAFLGYNVYLTKLVMYVLATFMAGLAGALSAIFQDFVSTSSIQPRSRGVPLGAPLSVPPTTKTRRVKSERSMPSLPNSSGVPAKVASGSELGNSSRPTDSNAFATVSV